MNSAQATGGSLGPEARRVEELALRMVSWRSETGAPGEAEFAPRFAEMLREIPYFRDHPEDIRLVDSHGDPLTRSVVAVVRGRGARTLALAGHFDTVSTENYHELRDLSCDGLALRAALIADLSGRPRSAREDRALEDLRSGDFLPGRGMLDMKSGIAAGVACLERFAAQADREGNLMLLATPDEERESRGMRSLRDALPGLARDLGLTIAAAVNMDVTSDQGDGSEGRAVYAGTIGKLLPFALIVGLSSHASYPYEGVSALAMAGGVLTRFEGAAALADADARDVSPPPICLEARDLRDGYEATTPERFWLAFNWLYHAMDPEALFARFRAEVAAGAAEAVDRFAAEARRFSEMTGQSGGAAPHPPRLLSFAELKAEAAAEFGAGFDAAYAAEEAGSAGVDNPLAVSRRLTAWLVDRARLSGPAVVVGFAGLHYPATGLDPADPDHQALRRAVEAARAELCAAPDRSLVWKPYFQGISDMSFLGQAASGGEVVRANTPISRLIDLPPAEALRFPAVNIGPWGREFHQRLERVHAPYAFAALPELVSRLARHFLTAPRG
ncbi:M20/M25/M40 family metallo-hydrolase [Neomegalonema perideroedes]|uniref:M20/M25/M40 family metallo-hydrolase n=1 Tax=Neomegalonema perideroedes TaxID=217219 RepID=UPI000686FF07|nr:M20/M25/M40 family metallo-hydrolase [Neomegalonema perideroedes]